MPRQHADWLKSFCDYAGYMEAPRRMHFWAGVSAIAGALRRRVWYDQIRFKWYPNFYIVFVAPPGVVSKSTTADVAMSLLRSVPGINFGPNVITWQALVTALSKVTESYQLGDEWYPMSAMTCVSSELGNLLNPRDREMVDTLITLWDGGNIFEKVTKMSGSDKIEAPWINIIGCTTPHWIAENVPHSMVGGGFTSRCIFVYAEKKEKYVPYLEDVIPQEDSKVRNSLVHDLECMSLLVGPYRLTPDAKRWGSEWYEETWKAQPTNGDTAHIEGYLARKQTMLHKLAMVVAASCRDAMVIELSDLQVANAMLCDIEPDMQKVFAKIGKSEVSLQADKFVDYVRRKGTVGYEDAYRFLHSYFPDAHDLEGIVSGAIRAGFVQLETNGTNYTLRYKGG